MTKSTKRPRDPIQLAKLVGDIATGQADEPAPEPKNPVAVESGRKGGLKGGAIRAQNLSVQKRKAIATNAAKTRWKVEVEDS